MGRRRGLVSILLATLLAVLVLAMPATARAATLDGVDISGWNHNINYSKLGDFVIIKATEYNPSKNNYTSYNDYQAQADAALKAGKLIGFYHFATNPNMVKNGKKGASIKAQAQGFVDAVSVKDANGNYKYLGQAVLCLDWEDTDYSTVQPYVAWAKEWLDYVYEKTGVRPVIYTSKNVTNDYNWSSVANSGYKLWGAMWLDKYADAYDKGTKGFVSNPDYTKYGNWGAWGACPTIYQYASNAKLHGSAVYDVNKFYGSKTDWLELAGGGECAEGTYDPATLLEDGTIYSFSPSFDASTGLLVANVSNNAELGGSTAPSYRGGYWRVSNHGDGTYSFENLANGKELSYPTNPSSGSNASLTGTQTAWRAIKCTNGAIALAPEGASNLRLEVAGGKRDVSGTNVRLYRGNGTVAQRFFFTKATGLNEAEATGQTLEDGIYTMASALDTSKLVEVAGNGTAKGANVQLNASSGKLGQRFQFVYKGDGLYAIKAYHSGLSLDIKGGSRSKGANVQQYSANTSLAQLWYVKKTGTRYTICSALNGFVLDAAGGKADNGTNIQMYGSNGTKAQKFVLTESEPLAEALSAGRVLPDGTYQISLAAKAPLMVSVVQSTASGANVQVAAAERTRTQKFELTYVTGGLYNVRSQYALKVLDVKGGSGAEGANVQQWGSNGSLAQLWYLVADGEGYQLRSAVSGNALSIGGSEAVDGANLCMRAPGAATAQSLRFEAVPLIDDGTYALSSQMLDTLALAVQDDSTAKGANVQIGVAGETASQLWSFEHLGDGAYAIRNAASGLVLEVQGGSTAKGANVRLWSYNGTAAQRWRPTASANGGIVLTNVKSGLVLDVAGGKQVAGTNVRQWTANGSAAQSFLEHAVDQVAEELALKAMEADALTSQEVVEPAEEETDDGESAAPVEGEPMEDAAEGDATGELTEGEEQTTEPVEMPNDEGSDA